MAWLLYAIISNYNVNKLKNSKYMFHIHVVLHIYCNESRSYMDYKRYLNKFIVKLHL